MPNIVIGLGVASVVLIWVVVRYFAAVKKQQHAAKEQHLKDEKYKRVLEKAKVAERQEKIFKAQTGHVSSQLSLAKEYELTNVREAIQWYRKAADLDNDIAQNALARLCRLDIDDPQGEAKSLYWEHVVRAKSKDAEALFELGRYKIRGFGTDIDTEAGIENIIASAELEHITAQLFLGDWYVAEVNPKPDPLMAFCWRVRAAVNQDVKGCIKTAFCYQTGVGVAKDKYRAIYWLERAAELGSSEAQFLAAKMHLGAGANDAAIAYIWFSIAHASGHQEAKTARDDVVQHIGIESILSVQNVAKSVYKILKQQPVPAHAVIELLDQIYGRQGYRPTEEMLAALVAGDFDAETELATSDMGDDSDGEPEKPLTNPEAEAFVADADLSASKNETAAKEYQQQNWATSWDSFAVENDKPQA
ncbi:sel1 repeat family protein [Photobacterium sp. SDRW27]|uniref:tetratricopeptide repeat protein n=1 Tax=Photobacterium obscurum TaxID=2829490 RepID=UPI0022445809|nr:tetratricopeptide repeat protein [Photobacterium obscurum]MCW8329030.1 sel1 repeat family protein [Photobacterium obscurum]